MKFEEDIFLSEYTTFQIGGPARFFYVARNKTDLIAAIKNAKENDIETFILGGGSNVLASSNGYDGLVIKTKNYELKNKDLEIHCGAGVSLLKLTTFAQKASLSGLEWAIGIPGTIGGAVYGNAQAFGTKMSDIIKEVEVIDKETLEIKTLSKEDCLFGDKESIFKQNKNLVVLSAVLELKEGNQEEIEDIMKDLMTKRVARQPLDYPSAGSIFINKGEESSSSLIDRAGLKGRTVGGAQVSEKHAGFIVNTGMATSTDILDLIEIIKEEVKKQFDIELEAEIQILK